jgi:hypothetical protein
VSTHFLATLLGTKKLSSATMADGKGNLSEIDSRNIIMVKPEDLSEESQKVVEEFQRALQERRKVFEEELNAAEENEMQALLSCFRKDRQGGVMQIQGDDLPSVECKSIEIPEVKLNITHLPLLHLYSTVKRSLIWLIRLLVLLWLIDCER